ncbi:hypothetical protein [Methanolobus sp. ZRKC5]|uniref:hypothetical protein n=1 Tax=unclassified Methanolobus TaxID=2629569 RepID=UPI00313EC1D1
MSISLTSATSIPASGFGLSSITFVSDYDGVNFLIGGASDEYTGTEVKVYYVEEESSTLLIYNGTVNAACMLSDGTIVFDDNTGVIWHKSISSPIDLYSLQNDPTPSGKLTTLADTQVTEIKPDSSDNLYVCVNNMAGSDGQVFLLAAPYYSKSLLFERISGNYAIYTVGMHPDGIIYDDSYPYTATTPKYIRLFSDGSSSTKYTSSSTSTPMQTLGIAVASNGDVYYTMEKDLMRLNYSNSWSSSTIDTLSSRSAGIVLLSNGVIYAEDADNMVTYTSDGLYGGYFYANYTSPVNDSSDSSSDNPLLLDLDGDGEFTQDDAKQLSLTLGPLMWILMFMVFFMVALGSRR